MSTEKYKRVLNQRLVARHYDPIWKISEETFEIETDENNNPVLDEDFTQTIEEFRKWAETQEETLKKIFTEK